MHALRRAVGRREVLLALLTFLLAGRWIGWKAFLTPAFGQGTFTATIADVAGLLDQGRYADAAARADALSEPLASTPAALRHKCLAQLLARRYEQARQTSQAALAAGASGADAATLHAVKALACLRSDQLDLPTARQSATEAMQLVGTDRTCQLLARTAHALTLRAQLDPQAAPAAQRPAIRAIRQVIEPLRADWPTRPAAAWAAQLWDTSLALQAEAGLLETQAGDPAGEALALQLLRQLCPPDAWTERFAVPPRALRAAREADPASLDDHARAALFTAIAHLYLRGGDRHRTDAAQQEAIRAYARLLEDYDGWEGPQAPTITPQGRSRRVGDEFYNYRNAMERLAKYSADWWGMRVLWQDVSLETALAACDHRLFRAIVRVRADRDTDPVRILHDEHIRPADYGTVADWFATRAFEPQADWERARAALLRRVGLQEESALQAIAEARRRMARRDVAGAVTLLTSTLQAEPELAETGAALRCEIADALIRDGQHAEALAVLDAAWQVLERGDPYLGRQAMRMRGRLLLYQAMASHRGGDPHQAIERGERLAADTALSASLRMSALRHLARYYAAAEKPDEARQAYVRLAAFPVATPAAEQARDAFLQDLQSFLQREGLLPATPTASAAIPP